MSAFSLNERDLHPPTLVVKKIIFSAEEILELLFFVLKSERSWLALPHVLQKDSCTTLWRLLRRLAGMESVGSTYREIGEKGFKVSAIRHDKGFPQVFPLKKATSMNHLH